MFDLFSWSHILILLVVALVVVGPKDLPRLMNTAGKWAGKARAMANEFRKSFDEMARQAELDELRKEIDELKKNNPISEMVNTVNQMGSDIGSAADAPHGETVQTEPSVTPPPVADAPAPVEGISEPRAGEFQVTTDTIPAEPEHTSTP